MLIKQTNHQMMKNLLRIYRDEHVNEIENIEIDYLKPLFKALKEKNKKLKDFSNLKVEIEASKSLLTFMKFYNQIDVIDHPGEFYTEDYRDYVLNLAIKFTFNNEVFHYIAVYKRVKSDDPNELIDSPTKTLYLYTDLIDDKIFTEKQVVNATRKFEESVRKRSSYANFIKWLEIKNDTIENFLDFVYKQFDNKYYYGSQKSADYAKESAKLIIKDFKSGKIL